MVIAIDYDGTFSLDPAFWQSFITTASVRNTVIMATSRSTPDGLPLISGVVDIVCCGPTHKREACRLRGYLPDIWIDDQPETINGPGLLAWQRLKGAVKAAWRQLWSLR